MPSRPRRPRPRPPSRETPASPTGADEPAAEPEPRRRARAGLTRPATAKPAKALEQLEANVPLIGLTGGWARASRRRCRRSSDWARRCSPAMRSSTSCTKATQLRDAVIARWGEEVAPGGVVDRAEVARRAFADEEGRAWLEATGLAAGRRADGELAGAGARARAGAARRSWSRCRCCSRRGSRGSTTRRSRSSPPRSCARGAPPARGHELAAERAARQLSQEEKAARATYVVANDGSVEELERELSAVLGELGR